MSTNVRDMLNGSGQAPALEISDLRFAYGSGGSEAGAWVVDLPGLKVRRGEQLLVQAPSGRGKSTLLQLIAGLLDPTRGRVVVDGHDMHAVRGAARDALRGRTIGMIFQTFNLLQGFSAAENVMAALMFSPLTPKEHAPRARGLLEHLGIARPDAMVEELSIGQQQRVAVARALACRPVLVLADEPTASLDPENAAIAMELIQSVCREQGASLLCVSHDPSMKDRFEQRIVLGPVHLAVG